MNADWVIFSMAYCEGMSEASSYPALPRRATASEAISFGTLGAGYLSRKSWKRLDRNSLAE